MTIPRILSQKKNHDSQNNAHSKQPQWTSTLLFKHLTGWSHQSQDVHPHNQSAVILHQFSVIMQEL